jgi:hypothetical protein
MANFADDEHIQWTLENAGDFGRHHHSPARQSQYPVHHHAPFAQVASKASSGICP